MLSEAQILYTCIYTGWDKIRCEKVFLFFILCMIYGYVIYIYTDRVACVSILWDGMKMLCIEALHILLNEKNICIHIHFSSCLALIYLIKHSVLYATCISKANQYRVLLSRLSVIKLQCIDVLIVRVLILYIRLKQEWVENGS